MPPDKPRESGRVALYARTWAGDPDNSLEVQVETLHEYTRRRRLEAVRVYFETPSARSRFHEMMAEATGEAPPFRRILVHDMGRLSGWADCTAGKARGQRGDGGVRHGRTGTKVP